MHLLIINMFNKCGEIKSKGGKKMTKTTYVIQIDKNDQWEDDWTYGGFIKF